ncbi:MAG: hypothetical protein B6D37_13610 [Sphingobacteriales bacterium UTBCD1]|jgi:hypothetical protein|nr:MAG: hypothetical protein B6D37_13610 [Sphingobacteriales bacterium UTBCD1]
MKKGSAWYTYFLMAVVLAIAMVFSIRRDIHYLQQRPFDLRNRIVGARMQMDGKSPYFYKWHTGDPVRYYDPLKFDTTYINPVTASPFFHHLLYPIANFDYKDSATIWFILNYVMYLLSLLAIFSLSRNLTQKWILISVASLFLYSNAWKTNIIAGQMYLVIAFLFTACYFFYRTKKNPLFSFLTGLSAASVILIKPTTIVFFLPFFFIRKKHLQENPSTETSEPISGKFNSRYIFFFLIPFFLLFGYTILNKKERSFWADYNKSIQIHIQNQQSSDYGSRNAAYDPVELDYWEGWDKSEVWKARKTFSQPTYEYTNAQNVFRIITGKKISYKTFEIADLILILGLALLFYRSVKKYKASGASIFFLFGFCLYITIDFFSPILRIPYLAVQWYFPLMVMAGLYNKKLNWFYILLLLGLLLNISDTPYIKLRHTLGEVIFFTTLVWLSISSKAKWLQ